MKTSNRTFLPLVVCAVLGLCVIGCNTVKGAGKDLEKGGEAIQNAAEKAQHPGPHTITASPQPGGMISPSGSNSVPHGSGRTYTIKANRGYHVADVLVDGKSIGARTRYTFDHVTADHTISAMFTPDPGR